MDNNYIKDTKKRMVKKIIKIFAASFLTTLIFFMILIHYLGGYFKSLTSDMSICLYFIIIGCVYLISVLLKSISKED